MTNDPTKVRCDNCKHYKPADRREGYCGLAVNEWKREQGIAQEINASAHDKCGDFEARP